MFKMNIDINQKNAILLLLLAEYDKQQIRKFEQLSFNQWLLNNNIINNDEFERIEGKIKPMRFEKVFELYPGQLAGSTV